jgi:hypothetical protein
MKYLRGIEYLMATMLLYLGGQLAGWWFDDFHGFFSTTYRAGYAGVVIVFALVIEIQAIDAPEGIEGSRGIERKLVRRQTIIGYLLSLILFVALIFLPFADRRSIGIVRDILALRWVGLLLCTVSYLLVFWSGLALGKQYCAELTMQKKH